MRKLVYIAGGLVALTVVAVIALVVITKLRNDNPDLRTSAPEIPTATSGASATTQPSATAAVGATASQPTPVTGIPLPTTFKFVIDPAGSEAKYVVREKLSRLPVSSDAVGTTNQVTGTLFLDAKGLVAGQKSSFSVDLTTLKTDESLRDNFVRQNVLQTSQFPTAQFVAESLSGFPASYVDGAEAAMTMTGTMTIHGTSKPVTWDVKARRAGGTLTGIADTDFKMSDFGINAPNVPIAKAEDGVHLQITIKATQSS